MKSKSKETKLDQFSKETRKNKNGNGSKLTFPASNQKQSQALPSDVIDSLRYYMTMHLEQDESSSEKPAGNGNGSEPSSELEISEASEVQAVSETPETPEVQEIAEVLEAQEASGILETLEAQDEPEALETLEAQDEPEVLETLEAQEVVEAPVAPIVQEVAEAPVAPIVQEVAEAPVAPIVQEVVEAPVAPIVQEVVEAPVAPIVQEVAEAPIAPIVQEVVEVPVAPIVQEIAEAPIAPIVQEVAKVPVAPIVQEVAKVPVAPKVQEVTKVQKAAQVLEVAEAQQAPQVLEISEVPKVFKETKKVGISPLTLPKSSHPSQTFPSEVVDSLRYLLTRLERSDSVPDRLAIVSASRQEGTSYICHALADVMAHDSDISVIVVELNWLWPSSQSQSGGLATVLKNEAELKDVIIPTEQPNLFLLPAGRLSKSDGPSMARSKRLSEVISELSSRYDRLILDIPAILATSDAIPLASLGDACCVVVRQGSAQVSDVRNALDEIDHLPILGVIMNQVRVKTPNLIMRFIPQK